MTQKSVVMKEDLVNWNWLKDNDRMDADVGIYVSTLQGTWNKILYESEELTIRGAACIMVLKLRDLAASTTTPGDEGTLEFEVSQEVYHNLPLYRELAELVQYFG